MRTYSETCGAPSLFRFGQQHRGTILALAASGFLDVSRPTQFVPRQLAETSTPVAVLVATEPGVTMLALNELGAEMAFHAADGERGLHEPMHDGWKTTGEARALGLPTYVEPTVLYWNGTELAELVHP